MKRIDFVLENMGPFPLLNIGACGDIRNPFMLKALETHIGARNIIHLDLWQIGLYCLRDDGRRLVRGDGITLPFRENSIGTVFMGELIEHVWDPLYLVSEAHRVLLPGGPLIITTPNVYYWYRIWQAWTGRGNTLGASSHVCLFSTDSLGKLLRGVGFSSIAFAYKGRVGNLAEKLMAVGIK